jgi:kynureninase
LRPGAPGARRLARPPAPFAFEPAYEPGEGVERMRVGTPPVLAMAALDAALDAWDGVSMADVRAQSIALSERFIAEVEARCPDLVLASRATRSAAAARSRSASPRAMRRCRR